MNRRPPRSTLDRSSAASDVYKKQINDEAGPTATDTVYAEISVNAASVAEGGALTYTAVSYTHLRAHETVLDIVCSLLLEKQNEVQQSR